MKINKKRVREKNQWDERVKHVKVGYKENGNKEEEKHLNLKQNQKKKISEVKYSYDLIQCHTIVTHESIKVIFLNITESDTRPHMRST